MDDIFEDAVEKLLLSPPAAPDPKDPSTHLYKDDILQFLSLDCVRGAMMRICEKKGKFARIRAIGRWLTKNVVVDITPEITVYRYSSERVMETLKAKVVRLNTTAMFEGSKTLIRALARDGLMDDGKEDLLECRLSIRAQFVK